MICVGKVASTHGIKGEIKIISDYRYKDIAFGVNNKVIINNDELKIKSYRIHKNYDMISFFEINNINDVLKYMKSKVYIKKIALENEIDDSLLIDMDVILNKKVIGKIKYIEYIKSNNLFVLDNKKIIPYNNKLIEKIDFKEKKVYIIDIEGLI